MITRFLKALKKCWKKNKIKYLHNREKYYMLVELFVNTLEDSVQTIEELEPLENLEFKLRQIRDNRVVIETVNPSKQA